MTAQNTNGNGNGNGRVTYRVIASVLGTLLLILAGWYVSTVEARLAKAQTHEDWGNNKYFEIKMQFRDVIDTLDAVRADLKAEIRESRDSVIREIRNER